MRSWPCDEISEEDSSGDDGNGAGPEPPSFGEWCGIGRELGGKLGALSRGEREGGGVGLESIAHDFELVVACRALELDRCNADLATVELDDTLRGLGLDDDGGWEDVEMEVENADLTGAIGRVDERVMMTFARGAYEVGRGVE